MNPILPIATAFPLDPAPAVRVKHPAQLGTLECRFPEPTRITIQVAK